MRERSASWGEESAGASFLRRDGTVWTTDKDGIIAALLAVEITARMSKDPGEVYHDLTRQFGDPQYDRTDAAATTQQKTMLAKMSKESIQSGTLAGEKIQTILTHAPGDGQAIGGVKVMAESGWFAARPSGTGGDLQDLRRELSRPAASGADRIRGPVHR